MRHIQVPKMSLPEQGLTMIDPFIYACVKSFENNETKKAWPTQLQLSTLSGFSNKPLRESINRLEAAGYFVISKGRVGNNIYTFTDYKKFEVFSYEFLENSLLSCKEKAYLAAVQQYMYKNPETKEGIVTYSNEELSKFLGITLNTLKKYEKSIAAKNCLTLTPIDTRNVDTGLNNYLRSYNLSAYFNSVAAEITSLREEQSEIKSDVDILKKKVSDLERALKTEQIRNRALITQIDSEEQDNQITL